MKTMINIKTDKEVKENAQELAKELGMPLSVVINSYLKQFIRNRSISFSVLPKMSAELERLLVGVEKDAKKGTNMSPAFSSAREMDEHLDSL